MTNNQILAAVMFPCTSTATSTFRAEGSFIDKTSGAPKDYDAYNYEVSISGGKANAILTWQTDTVEIDKFFLQKLGKTDAEISTILQNGSLEFTMDQSDGTGDYLISFYLKDKDKIPLTWGEMNEIITFKATQVE